MRHLTAPSNPALTLCQEWTMRTDYLDDATIESTTRGWLPFAQLVQALGLEAAIRDVSRCYWLSLSYIKDERRPDCAECLEIAHA